MASGKAGVLQLAPSETQLWAFVHSSPHSTFLQARVETLNKKYIRKEFGNRLFGLLMA